MNKKYVKLDDTNISSTEQRLHFGGINFVKDFSLSKSGRISFFYKKVLHTRRSSKTLLQQRNYNFQQKNPIYLLHKSKLFVKTYMHLIHLLKKLKHLPLHFNSWHFTKLKRKYRIFLHLQRWNLPKCLWVNFRSGGIVFVISLVSCSFVITQSPKNQRKSAIND